MGLRAVETAWVGRSRAIAGVGEVGVLVEQLNVESVDRQRERARTECRFALRILRDRMGAEIMAERLVLIEDDNKCLIGVAVARRRRIRIPPKMKLTATS